MLIRFPGCTFCRRRVLSRTAARWEQDGLQGVSVCSCIRRSSSLGLSPKTSTLGGHQCAPSRVMVHGSTRAYPSPSARPAAPGESCLWAVCHRYRISHRSADMTQDSGLALPSRDLPFLLFFNENEPNALLFAAPQLLQCH